jgi:hypothetical protein
VSCAADATLHPVPQPGGGVKLLEVRHTPGVSHSPRVSSPGIMSARKMRRGTCAHCSGAFVVDTIHASALYCSQDCFSE